MNGKQTAEAWIASLLKRNPDLEIDYEQSDPRLAQRKTAAPNVPYDEGGRGPESDLEEALLNYIRAEALPIPVFGHRFDLQRRWRFDMCYIEEKIAIEVDGGIYGVGEACRECGRRSNGGHNSIEGFTSDREKINTAQVMGWIVLGVTPQQINSGQATEFIRQALNFRLDEKELDQ